MTDVDGDEQMVDTGRGVLLTVAEVIDEGPDARSLVFTIPGDHQDWFAYRPGQFLTLRVPSETTGDRKSVV